MIYAAAAFVYVLAATLVITSGLYLLGGAQKLPSLLCGVVSGVVSAMVKRRYRAFWNYRV